MSQTNFTQNEDLVKDESDTGLLYVGVNYNL